MNVEPATFVRWVGDDESLSELVNEAKYRAWTNGAEHAVLTLRTGERPMIRGGRDGILLEVDGEREAQALMVTIGGRRLRVDRIEWHTHPRVTSPSDGDREAIRLLGQSASTVYEMGGDPDGTVFGPEKGKPLA